MLLEGIGTIVHFGSFHTNPLYITGWSSQALGCKLPVFDGKKEQRASRTIDIAGTIEPIWQFLYHMVIFLCLLLFRLLLTSLFVILIGIRIIYANVTGGNIMGLIQLLECSHAKGYGYPWCCLAATHIQ